MNSETYVTIQGVLKRINTNSFIIENPDEEECVVGRSCVHGADERRLNQSDIGNEIEIRIFAWLANKEGFV